MFSWFQRRRAPSVDAGSVAAVLRRNVWQVRWLPAVLRDRLERVAAAMVADRRWEGVDGLAVTHEMRATVAGAAALLTIGEEQPYAFERVTSIVLRPAPFAPGDREPWPDEERLGEAWHGGPIVLSWPDALRGARQAGRGENLVLHEFAHHLDNLNGEMDGSPAVGPDQRERWSWVAGREYDRLVAQARRREVTLLDQYGASSRAEFFAVATECFFERPHEFRDRHTDLYALLAGFFRQDPTEWLPPPHRLARRRDAARSAAPERIDLSGLGLSEADAAYTEGEDHLQQGRPAHAVAALDRAIAANPRDAEALALRSAARADLGDYAPAYEDAVRAIESDPELVAAHTAAAAAAIELADDAAAERHARDALRLDRDDPEALLFTGLLAHRGGRSPEALRPLRRLVLLDRTWDEAHYWLACALEATGDAAGARRHFERADWLAERPEDGGPEDGD